MANIRKLKKNIHFVCSEIIMECFTYEILFENKNKEEITSIISNAISLNSSLLKSINKVKAQKDRPAKLQFNAINKEFDAKAFELIARLQELK